MNIAAFLAGIASFASMFFAKDGLFVHVLFIVGHLWFMLSCYLTQIKDNKTTQKNTNNV